MVWQSSSTWSQAISFLNSILCHLESAPPLPTLARVAMAAATAPNTNSSSASFSASSSVELLSNTTPAILDPLCTINVKTHAPMTLQLARPNFHRWNIFFQAMVGKFGLLLFIDVSVLACPDYQIWDHTDYAIKSWLYTSVDDIVLNPAMGDHQMACDLYTSITDLFNTNQESHAIHLSSEFTPLFRTIPPSQTIASASSLSPTLSTTSTMGFLIPSLSSTFFASSIPSSQIPLTSSST